MKKFAYKTMAMALVLAFAFTGEAAARCCSRHGGIIGCDRTGHYVCADRTRSKCRCEVIYYLDEDFYDDYDGAYPLHSSRHHDYYYHHHH